MRRIECLSGLTIIIYCIFSVYAKEFNVDDYRKALWMTTRMYGGQRSGEGPNWLVMDHGVGYDFIGDADGGHSLSGGWHDCGDHVKFGQTQYYSAYAILKAYTEFPEGFDDFYSFDYHGYQKAGDFSWEGGKGSPNGIPDVLDEVKYATDYFIKCAANSSTFYYQVGEGNKDHINWVTSVYMATLDPSQGGEPRTVYKNPSGSSMASLCSATLALMSRVYNQFDSQYADKCRQHAIYAYDYAKSHPGTAGTGDGSFYGPNAKWEDDFVIMTTELYETTGEQKYLDEANEKKMQVQDHNYSLCYNNCDDFAAYNLAKLGDTAMANLLNTIVQRCKNNVNSEGVAQTGDGWGILRYSLCQAFSCALNSKIKGSATIDDFIYNNVDYVMGGNSASQSFIVGFGSKSPQHPHHRNVYLSDDINVDKSTLSIPQRNKQHGYMLGGSLNPGDFQDDINAYSVTEGGIDYNTGIVGALGYILSVLDPITVTSSEIKRNVRINDYAIKIVNLKNEGRILRFSLTGNIGNNGLVNANLLNIKGRRIKECSFLISFSSSYSFEIPKLSCGVYILRCRIGSKEVSIRIVINS